MSTWEVHTKGAADYVPFEICVIRSDDTHGKRSYGRFGETKLLISHNGGPCSWPIKPTVRARLTEVAQAVADELNRQEQR